MTAPIERLLAKLPGAKKIDKGWSAKCPAHDDQHPSLSIAEGEGGRVLLKCHAGCSFEAICKELDLSAADLQDDEGFSSNAAASVPQKSSAKAAQIVSASRKEFSSSQAAVAALERTLGPKSAIWAYHGLNNSPVGAVVRWDLPDGKKEIRPVSLRGQAWTIGGMPEPRPLYNWPKLDTAKVVFVCEGEKAAEAACDIGLVATTSAQGSESAAKTDWSPLAGKAVYILPDNDTPGRKYAEEVAALLAKLTPAPSVKIVELPGLPDKGDIVDWIDAGGTKEALMELINSAPAPVAAPPTMVEVGPILTRLADVQAQPVRWLWPGRIATGRITLLVGRPGEGKSFLTMEMAARVTTGRRWPDGTECPQGSVIVISAEDGPADTIRPRLDAHGADVSKVHLLTAVRRARGDEQHERLITLADVDAIEEAVVRVPDCKFIVVDPIGSFLGSKTDAHRDNEVRGLLAPIARLAEKHDLAVLVVAHRRKSSGSSADDLALGSRAFTGIARAVWHLSRDTENSARRLLLTGKNNLVAEGHGLAFAISGEPARICWEQEPVALRADDAVAAENRRDLDGRPGPDAESLAEAVKWLRAALAAGPRPAKELLDEWINGQSGSKRTLDRAKRELKVVAFRLEVPGPWSWKLADKDATPRGPGEPGDLGILAENTEILADSEPVEHKDAKFKESGNVASPDDQDRVQVTL